MTKPEFSSVEHVLTEAQERLDKPDFDAVSAMVEEALQRQFGALLGFAKGPVSPPKLTWKAAAPQAVLVGAFQYYLCTEYWTDDDVAYKGWKGGFLTFDPTAGNQTVSVDLSAAYLAAKNLGDPAAFPTIYVKPIALDMDTEGRRKWQGGTDTSVALKTRKRIRHQFQTNILGVDHANNLGWVPVARITDWTALGAPDPGVPTLVYYSVWDNEQEAANLGLGLTQRERTYPLLGVFAGTPLPADAANTGVLTSTGASKGLGLVQLLALMRARMSKALDSSGLSTAPWYYNPLATDLTAYGIKQICDDLQAVEAEVQKLQGLPFVVCSGKIENANGGADKVLIPTQPIELWTVAVSKVVVGYSGQAEAATLLTISTLLPYPIKVLAAVASNDGYEAAGTQEIRAVVEEVDAATTKVYFPTSLNSQFYFSIFARRA